ncbi:hypothetical protein MRX96_026913 [Rhipicephalus microplus]
MRPSVYGAPRTYCAGGWSAPPQPPAALVDAVPLGDDPTAPPSLLPRFARPVAGIRCCERGGWRGRQGVRARMRHNGKAAAIKSAPPRVAAAGGCVTELGGVLNFAFCPPRNWGR